MLTICEGETLVGTMTMNQNKKNPREELLYQICQNREKKIASSQGQEGDVTSVLYAENSILVP
jgi:hypothetical protein